MKIQTWHFFLKEIYITYFASSHWFYYIFSSFLLLLIVVVPLYTFEIDRSTAKEANSRTRNENKLLNRLLFPIYNIHEDDCSCGYVYMLDMIIMLAFYCIFSRFIFDNIKNILSILLLSEKWRSYIPDDMVQPATFIFKPFMSLSDINMKILLNFSFFSPFQLLCINLLQAT